MLIEQSDRATNGVLSADKAAAIERIEQFLADFPGLPLSENGNITIDRDEMYAHLIGDRP